MSGEKERSEEFQNEIENEIKSKSLFDPFAMCCYVHLLV